jgi:hypothetical protein
MTPRGSGLAADARERLERIVIELVGIAARRDIDRDLRDELMRLADQLSSVAEQ